MRRNLLLLGAALVLSLSSALAQGTERVIVWPPIENPLGNVLAGENGRYVPTDIKALAIVSMWVEGKPVTVGEPFTANDDWLKSLTVKLRNTSDRPIKAIRLSFSLPETVVDNSGFGFSLEYGRGLSTGIDYGDQKAVAPGAEVEIVRNDRHYKRDSEGISQRTGLSNFTKVMLGHATVKFEDGTLWTGWKLPIAGSK